MVDVLGLPKSVESYRNDLHAREHNHCSVMPITDTLLKLVLERFYDQKKNDDGYVKTFSNNSPKSLHFLKHDQAVHKRLIMKLHLQPSSYLTSCPVCCDEPPICSPAGQSLLIWHPVADEEK